MTDIKSLLNPIDESGSRLLKRATGTNLEGSLITESKSILPDPSTQLPSRSSAVYTKDYIPSHLRKKQKLSKDAAVFTQGKIRGECRYPPDEFRDEALAAHHQQYEIFPMRDIASYPRHIPYNSEKKTFLDKTGRECFEVLQYNFKVPGEEKVHCMMWDYNIGLVRITPLFKCTGHSKTTPAKMLNRNVGLREICHSITGGALVAQGYWMPYEAAKAIASTFCWTIRYALTPVFGRDFPSTCIPPDSDRFGDMIIDSAITIRCAEEAQEYRQLENRSSRCPSTMPSPVTPDTPTYPRHVKQLRPKPTKTESRSSGYSTDISNDSAYHLSSNTPDTAYRNDWTPANTPRSAVNFDSRLPSPREILAGIPTSSRNRALVPSAFSSTLSSPPLSPMSRRRVEVDEDYDGDSSGESVSSVSARRLGKRKASGSMLPSDVRAAYLLMSLGLEQTSFVVDNGARVLDKVAAGPELRVQKRRSSAPMERLVENW